MGRPVKPIRRQRSTAGEALGAVITDLRTSKTWSQQDLADKIGYSKVYILRVEKGMQSPTLGFIVNVAQVFGFRTSQLIAKAERKRAKR